MDTRSALAGLILGTLLQLLMIAAGHHVIAFSLFYIPVGMAISLVAGLVYAAWGGRGRLLRRVFGGGLVGAACGAIGMVASWLLSDIPALIIVTATASSAASGAFGALIGRMMAK